MIEDIPYAARIAALVVLVAIEAVIATPAAAADRQATFLVMEPLPDNTVEWLFVYTPEDGEERDVNFKLGEWSAPVAIGETTPRILVCAWYFEDHSSFTVLGEIPPLPLHEAEGEVLISAIVIGGDQGVPFEIKIRWGPVAGEDEPGEGGSGTEPSR